MSREYGSVYILVTIQPGKEQDFAYEIRSDEEFPDSKVEKMVFVHGTFDFLVELTGNSYEMDRRILKMRKLSYVQSTETLIPFKWEIPRELPKQTQNLPSKAPTSFIISPALKPAILQVPEPELKTYCEHPIVLYSTKSGNTKKLAEEISNELSCPIREITKDLDYSTLNLSDYDMVFIGTGIYRNLPNEILTSFLRSAEFGNQQFALFITWLRLRTGDKDVFNKIDEILKMKGKKLLGSYFECRGDYPSGYPDVRDFENAKKWASKVGKKEIQ